MDLRISVSFRNKGEHFSGGNEFKTESDFQNNQGTIGEQIGRYIDEELAYFEQREGDEDDSK